MRQSIRILSGMRATGNLHLGHYYGVIQNWLSLQYEYDCYFMIADIHALTTNYENHHQLSDIIFNMAVNYLACGIDPGQATIFIQSHVPEHAELHLLLSMITPLSWLERVPTYKDMLEKLAHKDIDSYGLLGYPLLQSADILLYNAKYVPVGEDQVPHIEITREIARRFNYLYGRELGFEDKAQNIIHKLGNKKANIYKQCLLEYQQNGNDIALEKARFLIEDAFNLSSGEKERLLAFLENKSKVILTEPQALVTKTSKLIGLDGQKMSKSYDNTISLREDSDSINKKIKGMQTDVARKRRTDIGDPNKCPVWQLHKIYSDEVTCSWVTNGCTTANIGCLDCKKPLIESITNQQTIFTENAKQFLDDKRVVANILADGAEKATKIAHETLIIIKSAMGLL